MSERLNKLIRGLAAAKRKQRRYVPALLLLAFSLVNGALALLLSADALGSAAARETLLAAYGQSAAVLACNLLPAVLFAAVGYLLTRRAWAGYLLSAVATLGFALANYFKIALRGDPLLFSDLRLIRTAGGILSRYTLAVTPAVTLAAVTAAVLTLVCAAFLADCPREGRLRPAGLLLALALVPILLPACYFSDASYAATETAVSAAAATEAEQYLARGFWYSFLHSAAPADAPEDYSAKRAAAVLAQYEDADIPDGQRVHVVGVMLEAFCDLTDFPQLAAAEGVAAVYEPLHELEERSVSGDLLTNIFAGGTVDTEWGFLTGYSHHEEFTADLETYVRWFKSQGYDAVYRHPGYGWFYNRANINRYFGFDESMFTENGFGALVDPEQAIYRSDAVLFDYLLAEVAARGAEDAPLFSFSVSYQNHGPYGNDDFEGAAVPPETNGWSAESCGILSHYLYNAADTIAELRRFTEGLDALEQPVVLAVFGDHKPWLGNDKSVYLELGVDLATDAEAGFRNTYTTPYLIWANAAAKKALGRDFTGDGGDLSPCLLMEELFDCCGWEGPAFLQLQRDMRAYSPLLHWTGYFLADGEFLFKDELPEETLAFYLDYRAAEYWRETEGLHAGETGEG